MTRTLLKHQVALLEAVQSTLDALEDYSDIIDGDDGLPLPNRAMIALLEIRTAYENYMRIEFPKGEEGELL